MPNVTGALWQDIAKIRLQVSPAMVCSTVPRRGPIDCPLRKISEKSQIVTDKFGALHRPRPWLPLSLAE